jgi:hypothetical protein
VCGVSHYSFLFCFTFDDSASQRLRITGKLASVSAPNNYCGGGPASSLIRLKC